MIAEGPMLLAELRRSGFAPIAGTRASVSVPIDAQWLSAVIAARMPPNGRIRDFDLKAHRDNEFTVRIQLSHPSFLPDFHFRFAISAQPVLPAHPFLVLRLVSGGLGGIAVTILEMLDKLPPGVNFQKDILTVDLSILAKQYEVRDLFESLTRLEIATAEGRVIVSADAAV